MASNHTAPLTVTSKAFCCLFLSRNTKLTSSLPRPGPTAVSDTTARWKNWLWTVTWSDLFGCLIPSSGTPRPQMPTGLQCPTSCSEYGTMGRYFTLWGKPQQPWKFWFSPDIHLLYLLPNILHVLIVCEVKSSVKRENAQHLLAASEAVAWVQIFIQDTYCTRWIQDAATGWCDVHVQWTRLLTYCMWWCVALCLDAPSSFPACLL